MSDLEKILLQKQDVFAKILQFKNLLAKDIYLLDLSVDNNDLDAFSIIDTEILSQYIAKKLRNTQAKIAIGGYAEDRVIYKKSTHFGSGENVRSIHLGMDVWCREHTPVYAPMNSTVHSFKVNDNFGDYGPTIILKHELDQTSFYTLYGHLSVASLKNIRIGDTIKSNEKFAELGTPYENGNWPPHLHFQIIADMGTNFGDFPGVCSQKEIDKFLSLCPNPLLILKL